MFRIPVVSFRWIKSFWTILLCMAAGIAAGLLLPGPAQSAAAVGDLYVAFLKMCVIPLMMTAIISSIGGLFSKSGAMGTIKKMLLVYAAAFVIVGVLGLLTGVVGQPGAGLSDESRTVLGSIVNGSEQSGQPLAEQSSEGLLGFFLGMVPANIFTALLENNTLQILFFSIIVGVAVGMSRSKQGEDLLQLTDVLFHAFQKAISWSMYMLPIGLFCMMAGQFAKLNLEILPAMIELIAMLYSVSLILIGLSVVVMSLRLKMPVTAICRAMKESLVIAFGTRNSMASIPSCMHALGEALRLELSSVKLVVPLGMIMCRYSMLLLYMLGIVFTAQIYDFSFSLTQWAIVLLGGILASIAGAGSPALVSIGMIAMIAGPLQLPADVTIILLLAINPIVDPIITAANVMVNCAAASLISPRTDADVQHQNIDEIRLDGIQKSDVPMDYAAT
ncbi:Proton/glutamate-aspartate symporter [Paenibacillus plantiphilus]|uniref:Proton/glutamate-aspartate symporter n=1 Tax=Paenibacillus plantiphilus TaxID=2905650 RepID=A0ABN8FZG4_9BACL|nr:cation:dicarboxylase symporter family transporter [Paenibacillus plantiphilus]CAH1195499.1 Proton/glutamate-aspartate symporter [Paenibacillus plantiphilus]